MPQIETDTLFTFIGADSPQVVFLQGGQWGPESTQQTFTGATWTFCSDGTFEFKPPIAAPVRNDLHPIIGTYTITDQLITFQGEKYAPLGASASLDGTLVIGYTQAQLDVLYSVTSLSSKIAHITQTLVPASLATSPHVEKEIHGVRIPSAFASTLSGIVDAHSFGPLSGMLRLLPSYQGDPNPFRIELATDATNIAGCIFWSSSTQHRAGFVVSHGKLVLLGNGLMRLEGHEHQDLISPSWFTRRAVQFVGEIVLGASAERGTLTLSVQGQHVEGTIGLTGKADLGQQSHCQARLVGESEEG